LAAIGAGVCVWDIDEEASYSSVCYCRCIAAAY
jgi:hypothetical protein